MFVDAVKNQNSPPTKLPKPVIEEIHGGASFEVDADSIKNVFTIAGNTPNGHVAAVLGIQSDPEVGLQTSGHQTPGFLQLKKLTETSQTAP